MKNKSYCPLYRLDGYMSWFLSSVEMCMDMKNEMKNRI